MASKVSKPPSTYEQARAAYPEVVKQFEAFGKAIETAGPLNKREQRLVKLGLAFGARLEGASHSAVRKALDVGCTPAELEHAAILAMTGLGFSVGVTCLCWVQDETKRLGASRKGGRK